MAEKRSDSLGSAKAKAKLKPKARLNGYLHLYSRLRGTRWTRYSKVSKLQEEFGELMEALSDYDADPSAKNLQHLKEESADALFCLLGISEKRGFDLLDAVELKIRKDEGRNIR